MILEIIKIIAILLIAPLIISIILTVAYFSYRYYLEEEVLRFIRVHRKAWYECQKENKK